jgi:hypothetical protein
MNDIDHLGHRLAKNLDASSLTPYASQRLAQARQQALRRAHGATWASAPVIALPRWSEQRLAWVIVVLLLVFAALFVHGSAHDDQGEALFELDLEILTSDLPVNAYVDPGFKSWLDQDQ